MTTSSIAGAIDRCSPSRLYTDELPRPTPAAPGTRSIEGAVVRRTGAELAALAEVYAASLLRVVRTLRWSTRGRAAAEALAQEATLRIQRDWVTWRAGATGQCSGSARPASCAPGRGPRGRAATAPRVARGPPRAAAHVTP